MERRLPDLVERPDLLDSTGGSAGRVAIVPLHPSTGSSVSPLPVVLLRGSGQILFQPSAVTGALFLLLVLWQAPWAAATCLAGLVGATLTARRLEASGAAYLEGAGGFNGALFGLALWTFAAESWLLVPVALLGGAASSVVRWLLLRRTSLPPFTAPYVLVGWISIPVAVAWLGNAETLAGASNPPATAALANSAQVLFLTSPWVGVGVIAAVAMHSRAAAIWITVASALAWLTAWACWLPNASIAAGLLGYNAMILAAALHARGTRVVLAVAGVMASVWLSALLLHFGLLVLSAPFVATAWLTVLYERRSSRTAEHSGREAPASGDLEATGRSTAAPTTSATPRD